MKVQNFVKYTLFLVLLTVIALPLSARFQVDVENQYQSWMALSPKMQLAKEGVDDQKGFGRVFVPVMSSSNMEPFFDVYVNGQLYQRNLLMGKSVFLKPGHYELRIGNPINGKRRIRKNILLRDGETKIIYPDWAGLLIRVVDPSRKFLVQSYEIFEYNTEESLGINISKNESEPDEKPDVWILPPGKYKIVKAGYPYHTSINFTTVEVQPGKLYQWTIVMDEVTEYFVGAGILEELNTGSLKRSNLSVFASLSSYINALTSNRLQENSYDSTLNISVKADNRIQYDNGTHYFLSEPSYEFLLTKEGNNKSQIYADKFVLDNLYIYYITSYFGFYGRADLQTKFFPETVFYDTTPVTVKITENNIVTEYANSTEFQLSPSFYPLLLKQGLGINFTPFRSGRFRFSVRNGLGLRQNLYRNTYEGTSVDYSYVPLESQYIIGVELSGRMYARLFSSLFWLVKYDVLFPFEDRNNIDYEIESKLNYRILKFFSIEYNVSYNKGNDRSYGLLESSFWFKFSYVFVR